MQEFNLDVNETMMIGDRFDTDVKFGNCSGMKCSALVLTGCTTVNDVEDMIDKAAVSASNVEELLEMMPTIIFPHVGCMVDGYE
jgi:ribonucleotide monophosphatase NagD (HAD superfamily)